MLGCGGSSPNARRLYTPTNPMWVCVNSPVPTGWLVASYATFTGCGSGIPDFKQIYHL